MKKRAVTYARVSGDDRGKEGRNLIGQLEICREYALSRGYHIVAELPEDDRGASGASFELPQLNQALEMARNGEFDILVAREIDRFARGLAKQLIIEQEFKRYGVQIEYVMGEYPNTPEGNLNKNIKAVIAEYERLKINERMVRGRRQKVKAGSVVVHGRVLYGYRLAENNGKSELVIYEPEAEIVRLIYLWYTRGDSQNSRIGVKAIAHKLTEMGAPIPTVIKRTNNKWAHATVNRILHTETYVGIWHYGKYGHLNGKRVRNPDDYLLAIQVPAIVDHATWQAAQERRETNKENSRRNMKYQYLLSKRVICGVCGAKMAGNGTFVDGKNHLYDRCAVARGYDEYERTCTNARYFRVEGVDTAVWGWVRSFLVDPAALENGLYMYQEEREREAKPMQERLKTVDDLLADHQGQLQRLLDLYLSGDFTREFLLDRKSRLEATIAALQSERSSIEERLENQSLTQEEIENIQVFAEEVAEGLSAADEDFDARRQIIEALDVQTTLTVENDEKVAYVRCVFGEDTLLIESNNTYRMT